jgi:hypothetical protein
MAVSAPGGKAGIVIIGNTGVVVAGGNFCAYERPIQENERVLWVQGCNTEW